MGSNPGSSAATTVIAGALYADHIDCDPDSCCQRNSGPDLVEATKVLRALHDRGFQVIEPDLGPSDEGVIR